MEKIRKRTVKSTVTICDQCGHEDEGEPRCKCVFCAKDLCIECEYKHEKELELFFGGKIYMSHQPYEGICDECIEIYQESINNFKKIREQYVEDLTKERDKLKSKVKSNGHNIKKMNGR